MTQYDELIRSTKKLEAIFKVNSKNTAWRLNAEIALYFVNNFMYFVNKNYIRNKRIIIRIKYMFLYFANNMSTVIFFCSENNRAGYKLMFIFFV